MEAKKRRIIADDFGYFGLEVFAGCGSLSDSLEKRGFKMTRVDFKYDWMKHDISRKTNFLRYLQTIEEGDKVDYSHFAPPCGTHSIARYPKIRSVAHPEGIPTDDPKIRAILNMSNRVNDNTFKLFEACCRMGIPCSIENPNSSIMWHSKGWKKILAEWPIIEIVVDYCQYGTEFRKRTKICTSANGDDFLREVAKKCPGTSSTHTHNTVLSGWAPRDPRVHERTKLTSAQYPEPMTEVWADCVRALMQRKLLG
jgi:hypothetical protein